LSSVLEQGTVSPELVRVEEMEMAIPQKAAGKEKETGMPD
jgi:hypothetical protein